MLQLQATFETDGEQQIEGEQLWDWGWDFQIRSHQYGGHAKEKKQHRRADQVLQNQAWVHRLPLEPNQAGAKASTNRRSAAGNDSQGFGLGKLELKSTPHWGTMTCPDSC